MVGARVQVPERVGICQQGKQHCRVDSALVSRDFVQQPTSYTKRLCEKHLDLVTERRRACQRAEIKFNKFNFLKNAFLQSNDFLDHLPTFVRVATKRAGAHTVE